MSEDNKEAQVRVLNEEYTRVLNNPENVIVSEDLQELLDIPLEQYGAVAPPPEIDTMVLSALDPDGLPISVRGDFVGLGSSPEGHNVTLSCTKIKQQFLEALDSLSRSPGMLTVSGEFNLEIQDCEVTSWVVTQAVAADFSLTINFRSENGIF